MDFLLDQSNIILLTIAAVSGTMILVHTVRKSASSSGVSVQDAVQLANRQHGIFVDIRSPEQFKAGSVPQARNVPRDELEAKSSTLPKDKPIILLCDTGQQAAVAAAKLRKLGFEGAVSMQGGLRNWTQSDLPLAKKN